MKLLALTLAWCGAGYGGSLLAAADTTVAATNDGCFTFQSPVESMEEAEAYCQSIGGHVAYTTDAELFDRLVGWRSGVGAVVSPFVVVAIFHAANPKSGTRR